LNAVEIINISTKFNSQAKGGKIMCRKRMVSQLSLFTFGAADTAITVPSENNGWVRRIIVAVPNFSTPRTAVITFNDVPNNLVAFTSAACANNATTAIGTAITAADTGAIPLGEHPWTITCTLAGAPGGTGGTVTLAVYYEV
jgi:hypothetical protein